MTMTYKNSVYGLSIYGKESIWHGMAWHWVQFDNKMPHSQTFFLPNNLSQFHSIWICDCVRACVCLSTVQTHKLFLSSFHSIYIHAMEHFQVNKRNIICFDGFQWVENFSRTVHMRIVTEYGNTNGIDRIAFSQQFLCVTAAIILNSKAETW